MAKKTIYLDYAAATPLDNEVRKAMDPYFTEVFGNPSSCHNEGLRAKAAVDTARKKIAEILGCIPMEVIFTSGGTESVNLALQGAAKARKEAGRHIITTKTEHNAVIETCKALEEDGFNVTYLDVDKYGRVSVKDVERALRKDTILVSVIYANNEIGTINPIAEIGKMLRKHKVYFHTDACQAAGLIDIDVNNLNVDLLTLNGSKIYGPKGVGLLYVKKGTQIKPLIYGGGQENNLRSGTENVPAIVGFAKALEIAENARTKEAARLTNLRDRLIECILKKVPGSFLNGHPKERLPNNANITIPDAEGEVVMMYLNDAGIYVSTGSACNVAALESSHVLRAIVLKDEELHATIRFTLGRDTTEKDIGYTIKIVSEVAEALSKINIPQR